MWIKFLSNQNLETLIIQKWKLLFNHIKIIIKSSLILYCPNTYLLGLILHFLSLTLVIKISYLQINKIKITNLLVWEVFNDFIKIIFHGMVKRTSFISNKKNFKNKEN